jgi:GT2 family glycosyltransferase
MNQNMPYNPLEGNRPEMVIMNDGSDEQVSIIVAHKDRPEYLSMCLQSIAVTSTNSNYEIIVSDNSVGDEKHPLEETKDYLNSIQQDGIKVIYNNENIYWGPAINKGVEKADKGSNYYIFMHCDVIVLKPSWIDLLLNISEAQKSGLVGVELQSYFMQNLKIDFIQEYCMLMSKKCWQDIGPFPKELPQLGGPFITTLRAQHRGWKPQVMKSPIVHHYKIFALDINEYERLQEQAIMTIPKFVRDAQDVRRV